MADETTIEKPDAGPGPRLQEIREERARLRAARVAAEAKRAEAVARAAKRCQTTGRRAAALRTRALCILAGTLCAGFGGEDADSPEWFSCDSDLALEVATLINREARRLGTPEKFRVEVLAYIGPRL